MSFLIKPYLCSRCALRFTRPRSAILTSGSANQRRKYTVKHVIQDGRQFRMAVIGSGPAGFYTAYKVMERIENAVIDMYEQLPVPFGLVRFGVAPDHPEVKNCQDKFQEVAESPNFNFIGNVGIGSEPGCVPLTSIVPHYDAILFAYGASEDRKLDIPGENTLKGIYSARAFVGWYNGLPEYAELAPELSQGEEAIVIGQGNVALDVARILLSDVDALKKTDITEFALEALARNKVKSVRLVGRRGPMQAAFTIKEARELMKLPSVAFRDVETSLIPDDLSKLPRAQKRIMELLKKGSVTPLSEAVKAWSLNFRLSPVTFKGAAMSPNRLSSISFEKTSLQPDVFDPIATAKRTGDAIDLPAAFAFRSIGYKSQALPGLSDLGVPFDARLGIIPNDHYGRVVNTAEGPAGDLTAKHIPGMYCAGWVKRGPTGVIASTMNDAFQSAEVIVQDWQSHALFQQTKTANAGPKDGWEGLKQEAERLGCRRVSWQDWRKIDEAERQRGKSKGKEREKFTNVQQMLAVLD